MGPVALFDKSFLQSLNVDEAVLFDYFFLPVVCPLFFVETLADLAKAPKGDRTAESVVGSIAFKSPEMHGSPCAFHGTIGLGSLLGYEPPLNGQIPRTEGRHVSVDGKVSVVFEEPEEMQAFGRWQSGEFLELERLHARQWRSALGQIDLQAVAKSVAGLGVSPGDAKSLQDVRQLAEAALKRLSPAEQLRLAVQTFSVDANYNRDVMTRWFAMGNPPLRYFARYANYVTEIEVFFALALASGKISADRASNRCDITYLSYLPFCHVFVSSDRLHRECAPLFMRPDQHFVWGPDLKDDLARQNQALLALPEADRERGLISLAPRPAEGLIRRLWEKHVPRALAPDETEPLSKDEQKAILDMVHRHANAPSLENPPDSVYAHDLESVTSKRMLHASRGSWYQLPKDMPTKKT
jgi:hypothetical protein